MTGLPDLNAPAFNDAELRLLEAGFDRVVNPVHIGARIDRAHVGKETARPTWVEYMRADLVSLLRECDTIAMLPNWDKSKGARVELFIALALGFKIIDAITLKPLHVECDALFFTKVEQSTAELKDPAFRGAEP